MTLDRNPTDYHTEIEQAAFEPNNLVPGIGPSPDKMLLGRLFSYPDAHRSPHRRQLPAAAGQRAASARCARYARTGAMRYHNPVPTRCTRRTPRAARRPTSTRYGEPPAGTPTGR